MYVLFIYFKALLPVIIYSCVDVINISLGIVTQTRVVRRNTDRSISFTGLLLTNLYISYRYDSKVAQNRRTGGCHMTGGVQQ